MSAGSGATVAWVFSVWVQLQTYAQQQPEIAQKEERIQELEQDVERYRVELEQLPMLPQANGDG